MIHLQLTLIIIGYDKAKSLSAAIFDNEWKSLAGLTLPNPINAGRSPGF